MNIKEILQNLQENKISVEEAEREIKNNQYEDLGYAKIDHNRKERSGASEVVFCQGKPDEFLTKIYSTIYKENGEVLEQSIKSGENIDEGTEVTITVNKLAEMKEATITINVKSLTGGYEVPDKENTNTTNTTGSSSSTTVKERNLQ